MCGIMGCVRNADCVDEVCSGLSFLEYRGYDSSGIAVLSSRSISIRKKKGRVSALRASLVDSPLFGSPCIGHTRWATHGAPDDKNAHPFLSNDSSFALVHNGVIENYLALKNFLLDANFSFTSDTDSEIIANLIQYYYKGDTLTAISEAVKRLKGSFAIAVISIFDKSRIFFAKKNNPLVVGVKDGSGYVCSDYPGLSAKVDKCVALPDDTVGFVTPASISLFDFSLQEFTPTFSALSCDENLSLSGYVHYMRKEIDEIPEAVSRALGSFYLSFSKSVFDGVRRIVLVGCGTALHACMAAKRLLRELVPSLDCYAESSGEFVFSSYPVKETLFIAVSQSGETADTLCAVKKIKSEGGNVLAVCNVPSSSIVRESDYVILTAAGTEIAVASTKAYNCQLAVLTAFCLDAAEYFSPDKRGVCDGGAVCELLSIPTKLKETLLCEQQISQLAKRNSDPKSVFYLGRGLDYCVACEGSLKLKEISYLHSEAYAAGELKHGTLALIEKGVLVIAVVTQRYLIDKMVTCIAEVKARGAKITLITSFRDNKLISLCDDVIFIPEVCEYISPIVSVIPTQLFAYYSALYRGCDIDKPRNLAKSVTVE